MSRGENPFDSYEKWSVQPAAGDKFGKRGVERSQTIDPQLKCSQNVAT
jgi:hypothetical protein